MRKYLISALVAAAFAVATFLTLSPLGLGGAKAGASNAKPTDDKPKTVNFIGTWNQVDGNSDIIMRAEISFGSIQVTARTRDSDNVYWMGSFDTDMTDVKQFTMWSMADPDAQKVMQGSLFGSQDHKKKFTYHDGVLSFNFKIMGSTTTVHLTK